MHIESIVRHLTTDTMKITSYKIIVYEKVCYMKNVALEEKFSDHLSVG